MREHYVNEMNNFIGGWYFDDTSICDEIIEYHKNSDDKFQGFVASTRIDTTIKKSTDVWLNHNQTLNGKYNKLLQSVLEEYMVKYPYCNHYSAFNNLEPTFIQHYDKGEGFYAWHTERTGSNEPFHSRHLVYMTYLNDVSDDGETEFFHQELKVKPEKGLTLIWPADWTFTHRGITSKTEEKYITTGWFNYYA